MIDFLRVETPGSAWYDCGSTKIHPLYPIFKIKIIINKWYTQKMDRLKYNDPSFQEISNQIDAFLSGNRQDRVVIPGATIGGTQVNSEVLKLESYLHRQIGRLLQLRHIDLTSKSITLFSTGISGVNLAKEVTPNPDGSSWVEYILFSGEF